MIVVGDLHGKIGTLNRILDKFRGEKICFVGDLVDAYNNTVDEQMQVVDRVLYEVMHNGNLLFLGNHELSYLDSRYRASGYKAITHTLLELDNRLSRINELAIVPYEFDWTDEESDNPCFHEGFIISHAGFSSLWAERTHKEVFDIGQARGGWIPIGGPLWCDARDEFRPIDGVKQVFGHTRMDSITEIFPGNWAIDCLDTVDQVLRIEDGSAEVVEF